MKKLNAEKLLAIFFIIFAIICIFTAIDYLFHQLSAEFSVPSWYFSHKLIYGTIIGFVIYLFVRKMKLVPKTLLFSTTGILLQFRYVLLGFPADFISLFAVIHFLILVVISGLVFKYAKNM